MSSAIVVLKGAGDEPIDVLEDPAHDLVRGQRRPGLERGHELFDTELALAPILRFGDAVRVAGNKVAGPEREALLLVRRAREKAEGQAGGRQPFDASAGAKDDSGVVPGVRADARSGGGIDRQQDRGHVLVAGSRGMQEFVG
jgi:hypothetical protein